MVHSNHSSSRSISRSPENELTDLTGAFLYSINPAVELKYNLVWAYGDILERIPQRLGKSSALDAAVRALTCAHSNFCMRRKAAPVVLAKYSRALRELATCLGDPGKARSSETLCAVYMLQICEVRPEHVSLEHTFSQVLQNLIGPPVPGWSGHGEGAAKLLKARQYYDVNDEFESTLLLAFRGPVVRKSHIEPLSASWLISTPDIRSYSQPENPIHPARVGDPRREPLR